MASTAVTQRTSVHVEDLEDFVPELWLTADNVGLEHMLCKLELYFGYNGFKCLGIMMAHMELNELIFDVYFYRYPNNFR